MKCLVCGFEHGSEVNVNDQFLCSAWVYLYSLNRGLPTKEQFEAMQREGFLPTQRAMPDGSGRTFEVNYGHYGWAADYNWSVIAEKIMAVLRVLAEKDSKYAEALRKAGLL
jgi:hypothetical protein